jgi:hypothetical protein
LREQAVKRRNRYQQLLSLPVHRRTGRPLAESTIKGYRSAINRYTREIARYEKEIELLRKLQSESGEWPRMHGETLHAAGQGA